MNKQIEIEDMAFDLCRIDTCKHLPQAECHNTTCAHCEAEALYNAGYRKASDVAAEIMRDVRQALLNMVLANSMGETYDIEKCFAEIEKKYESEGADDDSKL